jgi:hypothetical protein
MKTVFAHALSNEPNALPQVEIDALSDFLVTSAQGLWSISRTALSRTTPHLRGHSFITPESRGYIHDQSR